MTETLKNGKQELENTEVGLLEYIVYLLCVSSGSWIIITVLVISRFDFSALRLYARPRTEK